MKRILSFLCAIFLILCAVPAAVFTVSATEPQGITLLEQIIRRDGLIDGIWYPWIAPGENGHSLAGNEVLAKYYGQQYASVELDVYGADRVYRQIYNLKAMGYNMMAWGGSMYGEGVVYDAYGDVLGVKPEYLTNMRRLLDICREVGMPVMWNIYFHASALPQYNGMDLWYFTSRMLGDRTVADHYVDRFVRPVCEVLAEYPDVVALVSIADEPENEINDSAIGDHASGIRAMYGVNRDDMLYFLSAINDAVREELPKMPRTVASNSTDKTLYRGFALDLMGHNRYDSNANLPTVDSYYTDADVILTEYNIGGDAQFTEEQFANKLITFRERFMASGYKGGFQWCWMPGLTDAAYYLLRSKTGDTDFKETVTLLRHYMDDYRAAHQGKMVALDTPVLYCNDGSGLVEWIPSRQATKLVIERSDDGGKVWKKVLETTDPAAYVSHGKGSYKDTAATGTGFCYRLIVSDGKNTVYSAPNNKAGADKAHKRDYTFTGVDYPTGIANESAVLNKEQAKLTSFATAQNRPVTAADNLIKDGDFEKSNPQWNNGSFTKYAAAVTDKTAVSGSKSLYFDTSKVAEGAFYTFTVSGLQKNTNYTLSTWIKGAYMSESNVGYGSFGVMDPDTGQYMVYWSYYPRSSRQTRQIYPTAWDNEWHLRSVQFNSGDSTEVTLALYGYGTRMWLDDMALYRADTGVTYAPDNGAAYLRYDYAVEATTCDPAKSVLENVRFDDAKSTYWQSGDGWRNGFLTIADNPYEYGKSLRYTASADAVGNYYIRWVDLQPNTRYVLSGNVKILESGKGKLALIEARPNQPTESFALEFDADAYADSMVDGWLSFSVSFNTQALETLGVAVCDMGGAALIDNLRLFKVSDAKEVTDPYVQPTGITATIPTEGITTAPTETASTQTQSTPTTPSTVTSAVAATTTSASTPTHTDEQKSHHSNLWWILGIGGGLLLIGGAVAAWLYWKKKKT